MSKTKKLSLSLVCVICLLCVFLCASAMAEEEDFGYSDVPVYVDGLLSCRGYALGDNTYVSINAISTVLGYDTETDFDENSNTKTVRIADIEISLCADDYYFYANGRCLWLPDGYIEIDGNIMLPLEAVAKIFTLKLTWDEAAGIYDLDTANKAILQSGNDFYNEEDMYWMSRIITWESGNQPLEGQIAVGNVVMNRVASDRFPDTVKDVIFQDGQFSPVRAGVIYRDPYDISVIAAMLVFEDYNTAGEALFFQVGRYGAVANIATFLMKIGDHNFFI